MPNPSPPSVPQRRQLVLLKNAGATSRANAKTLHQVKGLSPGSIGGLVRRGFAEKRTVKSKGGSQATAYWLTRSGSLSAERWRQTDLEEFTGPPKTSPKDPKVIRALKITSIRLLKADVAKCLEGQNANVHLRRIDALVKETKGSLRYTRDGYVLKLGLVTGRAPSPDVSQIDAAQDWMRQADVVIEDLRRAA